MNMNEHPRLGIDIGRVIIDGSSGPNGDTAFFGSDENAVLATPEVPDAIPTVDRLVSAFGGRVWLVSKCGPRIQARTLRWLDAHDFYARTGLPRNQIRFCRARAQKRDHCMDLSLTHFVDDRADVHAAIRDVVDHRYLFGPQPKGIPAYLAHTPDWADAERRIMSTLRTATLK
jgi:tRNA(Leu) C34 or U34 (ribose-2'-O)-methylase TrmL